MNTKTSLIVLLLSLSSLFAQEAHLNQVGFAPKSYKSISLKNVNENQKTFTIVDAQTGKKVFEGTISAAKTWEYSQEKLSLIEFSALTKEGEYALYIDAKKYNTFFISKTAYSSILKASCKAFYLNRASMDIDQKYAGEYARTAGHLDRLVYKHPTAISDPSSPKKTINAPGGWYDAGDYNKYIVNSGISTYTLLRTYEKYIKLHQKLDLNIPESGNEKADLLDEIEYNINWMLSMQDLEDGGVYHKLTEKKFSGFVQPKEVSADRFVVMKTTAAALDFAAVINYYARLLDDKDQRKNNLTFYAGRAYDWAVANPNVIYKQPEDINTGTYGDENLSDEWFWANAEMYVSTKKEKYAAKLGDDFSIKGEANWSYVKPLGLFTLAANKNTAQTKAQQNLKLIADKFVKNQESSANGSVMGVSKEDFVWGSNAVAANQSMLLIETYTFAKDPKMQKAAWSNVHYLLGQNPLDFCYVTGFGTKSPLHIHHRLSASDRVVAPQPGLLAGGPNYQQQDAHQSITYPSTLPAMSYTDQEPSYASNEIAINWNAPLVYLMSFAASQK